MNKVFLDAAYAIALSAVNDRFHQQALGLAEEMERNMTGLITTRAVVLEIGNALSKSRYRKAAVELIEAIEEDPNVLIIEVSENVYQRGFQLFRERPDKEWSITDCISFIVMKDHSLTRALTTDIHFQQAGFTILLK